MQPGHVQLMSRADVHSNTLPHFFAYLGLLCLHQLLERREVAVCAVKP
jgi:hypothetical protein